jgi:hypothetical protein
MVVPTPVKRANTQEIEAANRAEVTALLIRSGYRVYRPEADIDGEDLVLAMPEDSKKTAPRELIKVQLKSRPYVDKPRYGGKKLWMLFPSAKFSPTERRDWFLIEHDVLFEWTKKDRSEGWGDIWSYPTISKKLREFLEKEKCVISSRDNDDPA